MASAAMSGSAVANLTERFGPNLGFIQQTADPKRYNTRPAPVMHPTAVYKKVDINANYRVKANIFPFGSEEVPSDVGLILWFPKNGADQIYHYGICPQGATSARWLSAGIADPGTLTINSLSGYRDSGGVVNSGIATFHYRSALALPRLSTAAALTISPPLGDEFSRTRVFGGILECWSSTIGTTAAALNGNVSAAVISDTRDIAQNEDGTDCFSVVDLAQTCRIPREIVKEVSIASGVVMLQGGDLAKDYRPPDAINVDRLDASWQTNVAPSNVFSTTFQVEGTDQHNIASYWLSPYNVAQAEGFEGIYGTGAYVHTDGVSLNGSIVAPVAIDPISEMGVIDIDVDIAVRATAFAVAGNAALLQFTTVVEHFFAGIADDEAGTLKYQVLRSQSNSASMTGLALGLTAPTGASAWKLSGLYQIGVHSSIKDNYIRQGGLRAMGKFIGAKVTVMCFTEVAAAAGSTITLEFGSSASSSGQAGAGVPGSTLDGVTGPVINVRAREINEDGECGPCHIIRYDQVGVDQNIRITGLLNTESVAKGGIAPYVQDSVMNSKLTADANIYPLVYMLYNGHTPFKCSWVREEWMAFVQSFVIPMSIESIADLGQDDPRVKAAADSAGFFSGLGGALGNLVDTVTGASGQFGGSGYGAQAAGQFGSMYGAQSAGQFGGGGYSGMVNNSMAGANASFDARRQRSLY